MAKTTEPGVRGGPPDPVDVHVGKRMELRRKLLKISQEQLANAVGVSFQQIQKYSVGHNRISASRLWKIANMLGVSPEFFYDGLTSETVKTIFDPLHSNSAMRLVRAWGRLDAVAAEMLLNFVERASVPKSKSTEV